MGLLINSLLFNIIWLTAVLAKMPILAFTLAALWACIPQTCRPSPRPVLLIFAIGLAVDAMLVASGFMVFDPTNVPAYVLVTLWAAFAYFCGIFFYFKPLKIWQYALLGLVSGPSSYWAAHKLDAVTIDWSAMPQLLIFFSFWFVALPMFHQLIRREKCKSHVTSY
ncbi:DUF2878 domain-containing protein [Thalassotalea ponticola]|uniref:DUF2878 domain-containing protein n=1 Tax=Thalassotalea ponticola TaxID=1523392 RepID=UPI0025B54E11|nr:DUF2878 domain-containing protein [Thalassotalea ponticola]MDN3651998.1 DUF2878 domain-containing protein [Thalassotalea ponticola]